jgi:hypothetical protein
MGYLGLDIGSTTVKACLLDFDGREVVEPLYLRSQGRIFETIQKALEQLAFYDDVEAQVGVTGSGREMVCRALGLNPKTDAVTEITAHAIGARHVFPAVRAIIDIGGQDSKIIQLNKPLSPQLWRDQEKRKDIFYSAVFTTVVGDFVMNDLCAAGTGAFLEMHGRDLGFDSTADFALSAADAVRVARVSGRCSVLAHSDVVHLRQAGESTAAIAAGLCRAVARNVLALVGGRKIETPILFQGGVAGNLGVVKALREELGVGERELVVPRRHAVIGALGAALHAAATFGTDEKITLRTLRARVCRPNRFAKPSRCRRCRYRPNPQTHPKSQRRCLQPRCRATVRGLELYPPPFYGTGWGGGSTLSLIALPSRHFNTRRSPNKTACAKFFWGWMPDRQASRRSHWLLTAKSFGPLTHCIMVG